MLKKDKQHQTLKVKGKERDMYVTVYTLNQVAEGKRLCEKHSKYRSHLSVLQLHVQEVKVSENPELLLAGGVVQRVLSGSALL